MQSSVKPVLQIAFQGGGARIGALLAAAEGVHDAINGKAILGTLSGTSAGAIAASMLASDKSPEYFRLKLNDIGPKHLNNICKPINPWNPLLYKKLYSGEVLYNTTAYRNFLTELFSGANLKADIRLVLPAVHLYEADIEDTAVERARLVDRIIASSAIPFIFHSWKSDSPFIDGGALNNLPVECLDFKAVSGRRIAITFNEKPPEGARSAMHYLLSLASCVIGYNVKQSSALVATDSVIPISTSLSTLSFPESIEFIKSPEYQTLRELVRAKVAAVIAEETHAEAATHKVRSSIERDLGVLVGDIQRAHSDLARQSEVRLVERIVEYRCLNLFDGNKTRKDVVTVRDKIVSDTQIFAYGSTSSSEDDAIRGSAPDYAVFNMDGKLFEAVAIGLPETISGAVSAEYKNMMLFFRDPLPVDDRGYSITLRGPADEALYDLINPEKNYDQIGFKCVEAQSIERLYLLCQVPADLAQALVLVDDPTMYGSPEGWRPGRRMSTEEISRLNGVMGLPEGGFARIGWVLDNVLRGQTAGFRALRE